MKTIMICLEKLDIGGVETAVINQSIEYKRRGFNVIVLSEYGQYVKYKKKHGVNHIEFPFKLEDMIEDEKIEAIKKIIKENNITQVHIHQLPCFLSVWCAVIDLKIPYVTYIHTSLTDIYDWYSNTFKVYKNLMRLFYLNSTKLVAISDDAVKNHSEYFNIDKSKYIVKRNSINFKEFNTTKKVKEIKKIMLISRISKEKEISIKNAIDLFIEYANEKDNTELHIWGDGLSKDEIEEYVKNKNLKGNKILFMGATNEVSTVMAEYDAVIGIGRCILEAIALKKIAIISGNEELKFIVDKSNIEEAIEKNFAGKTLPSNSKEEILKKLNELTEDKIKQIVEHNYKIIKEKLNIENNIYFIENEDNGIDNLYDSKNIIKNLNALLTEKNEINENLNIKIREAEEKIREKEQENLKLREEINNIYNSKRWKCIDKLAKIIGK